MTKTWGKLHLFLAWVFHPNKRNEANWREMRDNTRVLSARPYLPFVVRQNKPLPEIPNFATEYIYNANKNRLKDMADSVVQVTPPEPLYLREISPELPVQRTSYRDSSEGKALIVKYRQDLLRHPSLTCLPPSRVDDRGHWG